VSNKFQALANQRVVPGDDIVKSGGTNRYNPQPTGRQKDLHKPEYKRGLAAANKSNMVIL